MLEKNEKKVKKIFSSKTSLIHRINFLQEKGEWKSHFDRIKKIMERDEKIPFKEITKKYKKDTSIGPLLMEHFKHDDTFIASEFGELYPSGCGCFKDESFHHQCTNCKRTYHRECLLQHWPIDHLISPDKCPCCHLPEYLKLLS